MKILLLVFIHFLFAARTRKVAKDVTQFSTLSGIVMARDYEQMDAFLTSYPKPEPGLDNFFVTNSLAVTLRNGDYHQTTKLVEHYHQFVIRYTPTSWSALLFSAIINEAPFEFILYLMGISSKMDPFHLRAFTEEQRQLYDDLQRHL